MDKSPILDILRKAESAHTRVLAGLGDALGIGSSGTQALIHLTVSPELTPSELAARLRLTLPAVTALVDRLEAKGYALRRPHPSDRRSQILILTGEGRADFGRQFGPLITKILALETGLTSSESKAVHTFLSQFVNILEHEAATIRLEDPASAPPPPEKKSEQASIARTT